MTDNHLESSGQYPKLLLSHEINEPLTVVRDFFSADFPKGHFKRLREWRYFVINDEAFSHPHFGTGTMFFTYELNVKLLEAAYLILKNYQVAGDNSNTVSKLRLKQERHQWLYFPKHLKKREVSKPYKVLARLFSDFSLSEYCSFLHDWLTAAFDKHSAGESIEAREIIIVYDNMQKLYDATWLIHQRETDATMYRFLKGRPPKKNGLESSVSIARLKSAPRAGEKLALDALAKLIRTNRPEIKAIIHLGTSMPKELFHLLILVANDSKILHWELAGTIEQQLSKFAEVHVLIHKISAYQAGIAKPARFWLNADQNGTVLFGGELQTLSSAKPASLTNQEQIERAQFHWNRWGKQGKAFLKGAKYYYTRGNSELAAFMLHQSMESTLKGIIQAVTGYRIMIHNLSRILKISRLFTDDLYQLFDSQESQIALSIIQSAYTDARYKNSFAIDPSSLPDLIEKVKKLYTLSEGFFEKHMDRLKPASYT